MWATNLALVIYKTTSSSQYNSNYATPLFYHLDEFVLLLIFFSCVIQDSVLWQSFNSSIFIFVTLVLAVVSLDCFACSDACLCCLGALSTALCCSLSYTGVAFDAPTTELVLPWGLLQLSCLFVALLLCLFDVLARMDICRYVCLLFCYEFKSF